MLNIEKSLAEKEAYNDYYKGDLSKLSIATNVNEYLSIYNQVWMLPYYLGGHTKGYVRSMTLKKLTHRVNCLGINPDKLTILDAGCGRGELSIYLACRGYKVIGVDISYEACTQAKILAKRIGINKNCSFWAKSLENIPIDDHSIDIVIGHGSLHHFIKYKGVPKEFMRVMKENSEGYFADGFAENKAYHLFHDKNKMDRLGDVILTRSLIVEYFAGFQVELIPLDWFTMLDKLYMRIFHNNFTRQLRSLSRIHFWLDRRIPVSSRLALFLSGSVMTVIKKRKIL